MEREVESDEKRRASRRTTVRQGFVKPGGCLI
jgi:hypothetical protein